jgi:putative membrane protein
MEGLTVQLRTILAVLSLCGLITHAAHAEEATANADLNSGDRKFVQMSADMGAREVQFSERAKTKAQSKEVQQYAAEMIEHHGQTNSELMKLAERFHASGGPPYKRQDQGVKKAVAELAALDGGQFDQRYMEAMVNDHRQSIKLFERQAKSGNDPELKAFAAQTLPKLKKHLAEAERVAATLKTNQ